MKNFIVIILIFFLCAIYCFGENKNTYNIFSVKQENIDEIIEIYQDRLARTFEENGGCKTFTVRIKSK
jgi:ABC-type uncharacterized transport system auxiliary subunit